MSPMIDRNAMKLAAQKFEPIETVEVLTPREIRKLEREDREFQEEMAEFGVWPWCGYPV